LTQLDRIQCPHPQCGAFDGHHPLCPIAPDEWRAAHFLQYVSNYEARLQRLQKALNRQIELTSVWHGRWAMVKHENNKLRKKVAKSQDE